MALMLVALGGRAGRVPGSRDALDLLVISPVVARSEPMPISHFNAAIEADGFSFAPELGPRMPYPSELELKRVHSLAQPRGGSPNDGSGADHDVVGNTGHAADVLAEWLDAQAARDSNGNEAAWRLKPCPSLMFVNGAGELDRKHDQDLRDTCVMLLDRAGCDLLTICDITGHSYRSAQTIVKHYRARNADRADAGIDRLELQVRKEGMKG